MRKIKTLNYIKLSTHLNTHPPVKPTDNDEGPVQNLFVDDNESKIDIKKKWKKKEKPQTDRVYQLGIEIPHISQSPLSQEKGLEQ
ncbi:hypothetical protein LCGC14_1521910 [marine sediment metagenome]|uniref:Uncharacterized protein n=1 Tax=marine sediment metagenome TaxID=412755 RepID=A0A0F9LE11_9ZZZZ